MPNSHPYIAEDHITLREVVEKVLNWIKYLLFSWKKIAVVSTLLALLFAGYQLWKDPNYTAETTFVVESGGGGGLGQMSSLASMVGVDIGGLGDENSLFQSDNIIQLYQSRKMLRQTFLTIKIIDQNQERLITRFAREKELLEKWRSEEELGSNFSFELDEDKLTVKHDSILFEVIDDFKKKQLSVDKPDRQLSILSVRVTDDDELFAKHFNEALVANVNAFYQATKTKKSGENLRVLHKQADSVRMKLDESLLAMAELNEKQANPNSLLRSNMVPAQKLQIDIRAATAVYAEVMKNLEVAKINHQNNLPLIQLVDEPLLPLTSDKYRPLKLIVFSILFGGILTVLGYTANYVFRSVMNEN